MNESPLTRLEQKEKERNQQLLDLLQNPLKLLTEGKKHGVKSIKRFFGISFLFAVVNTILFFYALSRLFVHGFELNRLLYVLIVLAIGIAFTAYAVYKTYQFVALDTIHLVYNNLTVMFQNVCTKIVDRIDQTIKGATTLSNKKLTKALDIHTIINTTFERFPKFVRGGMRMIFSRIPLSRMIGEIKGDIINGRKEEASDKLYTQMDTFISDSIFGDNNTNWVWWILPLNIICVIAFMIYKLV